MVGIGERAAGALRQHLARRSVLDPGRRSCVPRVPFRLLIARRFGAYVFAIGGNREALRAGRRPRRTCITSAIYALGGVMAGVGALLLTGRMNAGHPIAAIGMEFDAIAAVIVGGTSFERGNGLAARHAARGADHRRAEERPQRDGRCPSSLQVASIGLLVIVALLIDSMLEPIGARPPAGGSARRRFRRTWPRWVTGCWCGIAVRALALLSDVVPHARRTCSTCCARRA